MDHHQFLLLNQTYVLGNVRSELFFVYRDVEEWMKWCFTSSRIALAEGARETVSLLGMLSTRFFCFFLNQRL